MALPVTHLLDTHSWVWFFNEDPLGRKVALDLPTNAELGVSAFSFWEAAMLEAKERITSYPKLEVLVQRIMVDNLCILVPLLPEIAIASARLPGFHGDPADRIIVATTLHLKATLVTADTKIIAWPQAAGNLAVLPL